MAEGIASRINNNQRLSISVVSLVNTNITVYYNALKIKLKMKFKGCHHKTCVAMLTCSQRAFSAPFPENLNL
jgi:hypothetical protein